MAHVVDIVKFQVIFFVVFFSQTVHLLRNLKLTETAGAWLPWAGSYTPFYIPV